MGASPLLANSEKRIVLLILIFFLSCFGTTMLPLVHAQAIDQQPAVACRAETHKPTVIPDRIILTWYADPCTTQAVTWRTSTEVTEACAEIAPALAGQKFVAEIDGQEYKKMTFNNGLQRIVAETTLFELNEIRHHNHVVRFKNLEPGTRYVYRVGDGTTWSEWFQFRTAAREREPFSFIYFGDVQDNVRSMCPWVIREAYATAPRAAFSLHGGDLTAARSDDDMWGDWFHAGGFIYAMMPVIATPGNHEYLKGNQWKIEPHWRAQFTFPENGPEELEELTYYVDYQNARIISMTSLEQQEQQAEWLEKVLADGGNRWNIITTHYPVYAAGNNRKSAIRSIWKPIFDRHAVDLVLTGHDHVYSRSGLIGPGEAPTPPPGGRGGTIYVVSVAGPKMNTLEPHPDEPTGFAKRKAEDTQMFQIISIDGDTLYYKAYTGTSDLYDAFTLKKGADGKNEIIEQIPPTPERRRAKAAAIAAP